jgi:hypothetical protein
MPRNSNVRMKQEWIFVSVAPTDVPFVKSMGHATFLLWRIGTLWPQTLTRGLAQRFFIAQIVQFGTFRCIKNSEGTNSGHFLLKYYIHFYKRSSTESSDTDPLLQ